MIVGSVPIFDGPYRGMSPGPGYRCCRSITGWRPSTRTRPRSRTPTPGLVWLTDHARRARRRPGPHRGHGRQRRRRAGRRRRHPQPRPAAGRRVARQLLIYPMLDDRNDRPRPLPRPVRRLVLRRQHHRLERPARRTDTRQRDVDPQPRRPGSRRRRPAARLHRGRPAGHLPRRGHPLRAHPQPSAACRSNCTCTQACRTSTTPSPSTPTCHAGRRATATVCCGACDATPPGASRYTWAPPVNGYGLGVRACGGRSSPRGSPGSPWTVRGPATCRAAACWSNSATRSAGPRSTTRQPAIPSTRPRRWPGPGLRGAADLEGGCHLRTREVLSTVSTVLNTVRRIA